METRVVSVKVRHIRPRYDNLKEWMEDENNVYIGRKGVVFVDGERFPKENSEWANPYRITDNLDRDQVILQYETHLDAMLEDEECKKRFLLLRGKTLGCWCKPDACHGDVIVKKLNEFFPQ